MFVVDGQEAAAEIREQSEIDAIVRRLATSGYVPVIRAMMEAASRAAGVQGTRIAVNAMVPARDAYRRFPPGTVPVGDLFVMGNQTYVLQPMRTRLHAWEIRHHSTDSALGAFCEAVEQAGRGTLDGRRLRGMDFTWEAIQERPSRRTMRGRRFYQEADLETSAPDYTEAEAQGALLLVAPERRNFALRLAQALGKARSVDTGAEGDDSAARPLMDAGVVRKEYLVLCRQDSHTICSVEDRSEIDGAPGGTFVCTICGRPFKNELIQEIFALTDLGKALLAGSRWMTIWITDLLVQAGISRDQVAWNPAAGEDELDIMTDALGSRVFFELKDREFGLGDAYPFAFRVARYGGAFGLIVTTDRVADEAKRFLREERPSMEAAIEILEGNAAIEGGIQTLVDRVSRRGAEELLLEIGDVLGLNLVPVLRAWMQGTAQRVRTRAVRSPGGG